MAGVKSFQDGLIDGIRSITSPKLRSNQAINGIVKGAVNNGTGAFEVAHRMMGSQRQNFGEAMARTFATNADDLYKNGKRVQGEAAKLNYGKIAGSYIGAGAALRVVSGGGIYKDQNGNANLIGIPFL